MLFILINKEAVISAFYLYSLSWSLMEAYNKN